MQQVSSGWADLLRRIIEDVWTPYGPFAALLFLLLALYVYQFHRMYERRLEDKNAEITRLVENRNKLQDVILRERLSSDSRYQSDLPLSEGDDDESG